MPVLFKFIVLDIHLLIISYGISDLSTMVSCLGGGLTAIMEFTRMD